MTASNIHDVLLRPVISEKSTLEAEFKVTVLDVRVVSVQSKQKRRGRKTMGTVPGWKKAIVSIAPGDKIELFEGA